MTAWFDSLWKLLLTPYSAASLSMMLSVSCGDYAEGLCYSITVVEARPLDFANEVADELGASGIGFSLMCDFVFLTVDLSPEGVDLALVLVGFGDCLIGHVAEFVLK